jgi:thiamine transporter ThiT
MNTNIDLVLLSGLTIAIMEAIKIALNGRLKNYLPLISIVIGIIISILLSAQYGWVSSIVTGIVIGSAAAGLYDLKSVIGGKLS